MHVSLFLPKLRSGDYLCDCQPGYFGQNCERMFNGCQPQPCQNDGTCIDLINGYRCNCPNGFTVRDIHLALLKSTCECDINLDYCRVKTVRLTTTNAVPIHVIMVVPVRITQTATRASVHQDLLSLTVQLQQQLQQLHREGMTLGH